MDHGIFSAMLGPAFGNSHIFDALRHELENQQLLGGARAVPTPPDVF